MTKKKEEQKTIGTKLRPSNADRYLNCTASIVAAKDLPVDDGTVYSKTGNVVHALAELCLKTGKSPDSFIGEVLCADRDIDLAVRAEEVANAKFYLDWINTQGFTEFHVEKELTFSWIKNPEGETTTGFVDFIGFDEDFQRLSVVDYKNGVHTVPNDSAQFGLYAHRLIMEPDSPYKHLSSVRAVRVQPNSMDSYKIGMHEWTREDLKNLAHRVRLATSWVKATKFEDLKENDYCEGHWCKFCPLAKASAGNRMCPKKLSEMFSGKQEELELASSSLPSPSTMTDEQIAMVLSKRPDIKKWLDDVYDLMLERAKQGNILSGMKLVDLRAKPRAWKKELDDATIVEGLVQAGVKPDLCYKKKEVITPATVKKILKGDLTMLEDMLTPPEVLVQLVSMDDGKTIGDGSDLF